MCGRGGIKHVHAGLCRRLPGQTQADAISSLIQPPAPAPPDLCRVFGALCRLLLCELGVQPLLLSFEARQVACILLLGPVLLLCLNIEDSVLQSLPICGQYDKGTQQGPVTPCAWTGRQV